MPQVIYAWNYVEWGGAQIHFLALIREARKRFDVILLVPEGTDQQFLGFLDNEAIKYKTFRGNIDLGPKRGIGEKVTRHWKRIKSEYAMLRAIEGAATAETIVHTDISPGQSLASLVWLCLRFPTFITLHNAQPAVPWWRLALWKLKYRTISQFSDFHVFCTNEHAAEYYRRLCVGRVSREIKITYDSINPDEIDEAMQIGRGRDQLRSRFDIPHSAFVILTVGQFIDRKGRWTLLESARLLDSTENDLRFIWVTPSMPGESERSRIREYGLGDKFRLIRSTDVGADRSAILGFFVVADLFALPSYVEGIPIALLEAMASGLPCVSTNVYGIPEAIIDNETGLLIEAGDANGLARAIDRIANDVQLLERLAENGKHRARTVFDERVAATRAVESYEVAFASVSEQ